MEAVRRFREEVGLLIGNGLLILVWLPAIMWSRVLARAVIVAVISPLPRWARVSVGLLVPLLIVAIVVTRVRCTGTQAG